MLSNQLHINMSKCNYMYFDPGNTCARSNKHYNISINGHKINRVNNIKFLGVIIDDNLSWIPHIEYLNKKLKSSIGIIKCINNQYQSPSI